MPKKKTGNVEEISDYSTCWFCGERPSEAKATYQAKMHYEIDRKSTLEGTKVKYQRIAVPVPRCARCKRAHTYGSIIWGVSLGLGFVAGLAFWIWRMLSEEDTSAAGNVWAGVIIILIGLVAGGIIGGIIHWLTSPKGVKSKEEAEYFPEVKKLRAQGWQMGKEPTK